MPELVQYARLAHRGGEGEGERDGLGGAGAKRERCGHYRVCKASLSPLYGVSLLGWMFLDPSSLTRRSALVPKESGPMPQSDITVNDL
jgi:hypothetical protein